jgi:hypothetical protein
LSYTFSVAVMPNLAGADDRTFVATMQRYNEDPAFPLSFTAALVLVALAAVLQRRPGPAVAARWPSPPSPVPSSSTDGARTPRRPRRAPEGHHEHRARRAARYV